MSRFKTFRFKVLICPKCKYEWIPRITTPKTCPSCKFRLNKTVRPRKKVALRR